MGVIRLFDEKQLIYGLQGQTIEMIRGCIAVPPVRKFIECYDILDLTRDIYERFPTETLEMPVCDQGALLRLRTLTGELMVFHGPEIPQPDFFHYRSDVLKLLRCFGIPS